MNRNIHELRLLFILLISMTIPVFASPRCGPCQVPNPDQSEAWGKPCVDKQGRKCGVAGNVVRVPDVNFSIADCGVCPTIVETVELAKCENSGDPCDTCTEVRRINKKRHLYKCTPPTFVEIYRCKEIAIRAYRGTLTDDAACDPDTWDAIRCLGDLAEPNHPGWKEYQCELIDCDCGDCVEYRVYRSFGMGCGGGL